MKKSGILNPELIRAIAELGHNHTYAVVDAGMPIPDHVERIDLSLIAGLPTVEQVLRALVLEAEVQGYVLASETLNVNAPLSQLIANIWPDADSQVVSHDEMKRMLDSCRFVIRTGEFTPYANVILVSGVPF